MLPNENEVYLATRDGVPGWTDGRRWVPIIAGGGEDGDGGEGDGNDGADGEGEGGDDLASLRSAIESERDRSRKAERRARDADRARKDAEQKLKDAEGGKLSEIEALQKQVADLTARSEAASTAAKTAVTTVEIVKAAASAGAIDPEAIPKLIDLSKVETDDDGKPEDVKALIEGLKEAKPQWFGARGQTFDGGRRGGGSDKSPGMNDLIRAAAGH